MVQKRKFGAVDQGSQGDVVAKPAVGTKTFTTGVSVREGLASGSRQAFVAFHQQIYTPHSALPLPISHQTVVILQHYHQTSPTFDEIFNVWKDADRGRNERLVESAVQLLTQIIQILTGLPFFRNDVLTLVKRIISSTEPYPDLLNRLILSAKRDQSLTGLHLAAVCVQVDVPNPAAGPSHTSSGRLAMKLWQCLIEGGSAKIIGKMLGMRRRNKEGIADYGAKDPLDRPDIRHATLHLIIPLMSLPTFHAHTKSILPTLYNNLASDPPTTIYRILTGIWEAISSPSAGIARRTALALLDENALENLLALLNRGHIEPTTGKTVSDMVMGFLEAVTTVPGRGICFPDEGWFPRRVEDHNRKSLAVDDDIGEPRSGNWKEGKMRRGLHNRILSNVVRKVGSKVVDGQGRIGDWVIMVLNACPELVAGYWPHSALSLDPKLHPRWLATISYVGRIISLPPPPISTFYEPVPRGALVTSMPPRAQPPSVGNMIESIFPAPLGKVHLTKGLQHADLLVQHVTALSLARGLQKLEALQAIFSKIEAELESEPSSSRENPWFMRRFELELECKKRVPDVLVVIAFAQKSATLARVPADSDDEPEPKLVAQSAMLTEVALRLFGLYHRTLPSIAREAKFDVGKLLVSSSSAKAERRERREAREGSVISDTGSVGSVGTIGTVGMGGGFGQSRGDVDGFEAMSQVHVLSLLTEVKEFSWTNKASGSQYSYLYHILILHLSTPHPITQKMTSNLLNRLLLPSILFSHDRGELEIWLSALPSLSALADLDITQCAFLVAQQIQLLAFIDECVRRCMKTPYKYIEDVLALVPEYFQPIVRPYEMASPILMAVLEQLHAKIQGQHMSTEAAGIVVAYLQRVFLGLSGKMRDSTWLEAVAVKMEASVVDARGKGQERKGLLGSIGAVQAEVKGIYGGSVQVRHQDEQPAVKLLDQEIWAGTSFEQKLLRDLDLAPEPAKKYLDSASPAAIARYGHFATHLIATTAAKGGRVFEILRDCLLCVDQKHALQLHQAVFENPAMKAIFLDATIEDRLVLDEIVSTLKATEKGDFNIADVYVHELVAAMTEDKRGKRLNQVLALASPWTRFFTPEQAVIAVDKVAQNSKRFKESTTRVKAAISALIVGTQDPALALGHLSVFVALSIITPFATLLKSLSSRKGRMDEYPTFEVDEKAISGLLAADRDDVYDLVLTLVEVSPSALRATASVLQSGELLTKPAVLPIVASIMDVSDTLIATEAYTGLVSVCVNAIAARIGQPQHIAAASRTLLRIGGDHIDALVSKLLDVSLAQVNLSLAKLATSLVAVEGRTFDAAVSAIGNIGLQYLTRAFSSGAALSIEQSSVLKELTVTFGTKELDLDPSLVEPAILAVVQDRLDEPEATEFCAILVERSTLKASFIRQAMSQLYSSATYNSLASPVPGLAPARNGFIHLLAALFASNPYISCSPNFLEQLLPLYRGTLGISDRRILSLFHLFESYRHLSVSSVLHAWSASGGTSKRPFEALTSLEPAKVLATSNAFPLRLTARTATKDVGPLDRLEEERAQGMYDPTFVLSLFAGVLREQLHGLDWVEILRSNVLGLAVSSLSSRDSEMRNLGGYALAKVYALLQNVAFQERDQLAYILRLIRHAIEKPEAKEDGQVSQPRLPVITTTFLAQILRTLASPSNPLYADASRFLLQRAVFDPKDVPMLFGMLYAYGDGFRRDRAWIVRLIRDASRSDVDWRLLKRRKTIDLLETLYQVSLEINFRRLVLQAMESVTRLQPAAMSLVYRGGFISWLNIQWINSESDALSTVEEERAAYLNILENLVIMLAGKEQKNAEQLESGELKVKGRDWIDESCRLLLRAAKEADLERLSVISRILARLYSVPLPPNPFKVLPPFVNRLKELRPNPTSDSEGKDVYTTVVENFFRVTLRLQYGGMTELRDAVEEIGWRAGLIEGEVGDWVRNERRKAIFEAQRRAS